MSASIQPDQDVNELHWMMELLTNVDVGLVVLDSAYTIQMWNRFMSDHSGRSDREVKQQSIFDVFPELPEGWFKHKIDSVFTLKSRAFSVWEQRPYLFRFKNYRPITGVEEIMYQNATMFPILSPDGSVNHVALLIYDVTDIATNKKELTSANQKLDTLSKTDRLTELNNRGFWEQCFQMEFKRCQRYEHESSLLILDIDHFKRINDTYGHQAGDQVIRETARLLRQLSRDTDVLGRYGGEEFVCLLPNTNQDNASILAERFLEAVRQLTVTHQGTSIQFTISVGLAEYRSSYSTYEQWIELADQALYHSKQNGRNQLTISDKTG